MSIFNVILIYSQSILYICNISIFITMQILIEKHNTYISKTTLDFQRSIINELPWNERLIGIKGSRGVGKTTLLLQYIKTTYNLSPKALYISLDDIYFSENKLINTVDDFVKQGGEHLFIDEVHKYTNWAIEIKNIYDYYTDLKIVFTGSSLLEILNSRADLSRRALVYQMQGLSFREYLQIKHNLYYNSYSLEEITTNHIHITAAISSEIKPLQYFAEYLEYGYYPFYNNDKSIYQKRLSEIINMIIEIELPLLRNVEISKVNKIKQLLYIISQSVPFKPNISKLSKKIGISRNTLIEYINHLNDVNILNTLNKNSFGISLLQKPEKIYLENTNIAYLLSDSTPNIGSIRETFFLNQLQYHHIVTYPNQGDFLVNNALLFEIGGKNKTHQQIKNIENSYIVSDGIEIGSHNKIPLWLFGFLY